MPDILKSISVALGLATIDVGDTTEAKSTLNVEASDELLDDNFPVVWSSSNTAVASITPAGIVTGVGAGTAQIRATSGAVVGFATITVQALPVILIDAAAGALIANLPFGNKFILKDPTNQMFTCQKNFS